MRSVVDTEYGPEDYDRPVRGGAYLGTGVSCRSVTFAGIWPNGRYNAVGFRLALRAGNRAEAAGGEKGHE